MRTTTMYQICRHIKTNGLRCESPALRDAQFCYYHSKIHTVGAEPHLKYGPLQLPAPEDAAAIQLSVARINDAIINDRINLKKATALLYGIQIAAQFVDRKNHSHEAKPVQSVELTSVGDELAPGIYSCKDEDCNECPFSNPGQCTRWHYTATSSQSLDDGGDEEVGESGDDGKDGDLGEEKDDGENGEAEPGSDDGGEEDGSNTSVFRPGGVVENSQAQVRATRAPAERSALAGVDKRTEPWEYGPAIGPAREGRPNSTHDSRESQVEGSTFGT